MPMIQPAGQGPLEWQWERPNASPITWSVQPIPQPDGSHLYELSVMTDGGNEIVRLREFTKAEMSALFGAAMKP